MDRRPAGFHNTFVVYKPTDEADGTRNVVYTLWKYGVSPAVLVFGCQHWIVVRGVRTSVEPTPGTAYTVDGFWVDNPVYYSSTPPPPHDGTDACGSGGSLGIGNQFVTYAYWQNTYFTGCVYDDPTNNKQWVAVCDPDARDISLPERRPRLYRAQGERFIVQQYAREFAEEGVKEYSLREYQEADQALGDATPGQPLLVMRLDRPDTYYYLIPWIRDGRTTAVSQVDALYGEFQSLHLLSAPVRGWNISRRQATANVINRRFEFPSEVRLDTVASRPESFGDPASELRAGRMMAYGLQRAERYTVPAEEIRLHVRPGAYCLAPTLVWKPCRESFSPHLPFYQFNVGDHKLYVRTDGEVFTHLTTIGRGM